MKMRNRIWAMLLAIGFAVLATGRTGFADESVPSERRLPKNVVAYVSLRDVADFKSQWSKTLFGQMVDDDAVADFRADVVKHFTEVSEQVESQLGIGLSDLLSIPHGEIAAAGVVLPGGKLSGVLFLDFGDRQEAVQKLIDKASESLGENHKRTEEEIDDTKVVAFQLDDGDGGKKSQAAAAYFMKDSFLVLGTHVATLKEVLTRWDGKHDKTLADNDTYHYILDKCRDEASEARPQLVWFLNPVALVQSWVASQPQLAAQATMAMGVIPLVGLDKFKGLGGTLDMARGEFDTVSRTLIVLDRADDGIVNLFQFPSVAQAPPKWLSSDWMGYMAFNWNAAKAYSAIEALVDKFQPPGTFANLIQGIADNPGTGGIHLKKDLIDQLTGVFHIVQDDGGVGGKSAAERFLFGIQIKNAAAARATLAKVARLPGSKVTEREFQGETLYETETAAGDDDDDDDADGDHPKLGFAVTEGHVMIATDVRLLERVLRGLGDRETLAESAAYKHIARKFPVKTCSIGYNRQDTQLKTLVEVLKSGQLNDLMTVLAGDFEGFDFSKVFDFSNLDFSKLPDFDLLKKYMPPTGSFMEPDARGLKITSFSLRNESE